MVSGCLYLSGMACGGGENGIIGIGGVCFFSQDKCFCDA